MSALLRRESGIAGIVLTLVIAWALGAVLMLTRTLVAAQQIDTKVAGITGETGAIQGDTQEVKLLETTNRVAAAILKAAEPLSGQLDEVEAAAASIDRSVGGILASVGSIGTTVRSISGLLDGILSEARSIDRGVAAINDKAAVALRLVGAVERDTSDILDEVVVIRKHAKSIDCKSGNASACR